MKQNKKNKNNFYVFVVAVILVIASLSFFSSADDEMQENIFEDFDGDGLSNSEEEAFGTDPKNKDTDGDGYSDGVEIESGYDPLIPAPGDRIIQDENLELVESGYDDGNLTKKLSDDLVEYIAEAKESGKEEISTEDISELASKSVEDTISFDDIEIDVSDFNIKEQNYDNLSEKKRKEKEKEDAIEYFTAVSYIFMTNFPEGFFEQSPENLGEEVLDNAKTFSNNLTSTEFFEDLAKNAINAEEEMKGIEVPESLAEVHFKGLYILRYMKSIYSDKEYKNVNEDAMSMIVTLTKMEGLLELTNSFIEDVDLILKEYEIEDSFLDL